MEFVLVGSGKLADRIRAQASARRVRVLRLNDLDLMRSPRVVLFSGHAWVGSAFGSLPSSGDRGCGSESLGMPELDPAMHERDDSLLDNVADLLLPDDVIVDCSSSGHRTSLRRHERLRQRDLGYVDCLATLSGEILFTSAGFIVGGREADVKTVTPLLRVLAPQEGGVLHFGPAGSAHFARLLLGSLEFNALRTIYEASALVRASEFDVQISELVSFCAGGLIPRDWIEQVRRVQGTWNQRPKEDAGTHLRMMGGD